ncbi:MAG TPA: YoaK family protein [Opitutaceae bacterium]
MLSQGLPRWVAVGGFTLTCVAGAVNAVGFLGVHHQALSHMSGTGTIFSTELALGRLGPALHAGLVLGWFFLGCVLSGMIIRQSTLKAGRRYGVALTCESILLFSAAYFLRNESNIGDYLAAMACGLQNAMATSYSGAVVRTTHITGIITDLGIAVGHAVRREPVDRHRVTLFALLVAGFLVGGVLGGWGFLHFGSDTLLFPATATGLAGIGYALFKHRERKLHHPLAK